MGDERVLHGRIGVDTGSAMKIGIRSPFTGLMASAPMATPVFSRSAESR
jgi:hypothetical protein